MNRPLSTKWLPPGPLLPLLPPHLLCHDFEEQSSPFPLLRQLRLCTLGVDQPLVLSASFRESMILSFHL